MTSTLRAAIAALLYLAASAQAQEVPRTEPGFTDAITEMLRTALPDEHVVPAGPQRVTVGTTGMAVNMGRLWQYCTVTNPARCDAESAHFVAGVAESFKDLNKPPERAQVRLVLRSVRTAQAFEAHGRGTGLSLQVRPFLQDMVDAVVIDSPRTVRWASNHDTDALKISAADLFELARANTHAQMQPLMKVAEPATAGKIGAIDGDDAYTASRLLYPQDWAPLAKAQGGVLIIVAPRPTTLLYVGADDEASVAALREFARERLTSASDGLSTTLLRWTPEGWKPLP